MKENKKRKKEEGRKKKKKKKKKKRGRDRGKKVRNWGTMYGLGSNSLGGRRQALLGLTQHRQTT